MKEYRLESMKSNYHYLRWILFSTVLKKNPTIILDLLTFLEKCSNSNWTFSSQGKSFALIPRALAYQVRSSMIKHQYCQKIK
jgi:hypothetical protein